MNTTQGGATLTEPAPTPDREMPFGGYHLNGPEPPPLTRLAAVAVATGLQTAVDQVLATA